MNDGRREIEIYIRSTPQELGRDYQSRQDAPVLVPRAQQVDVGAGRTLDERSR